MLKFLLVVHYFAPHIGGMETVVAKQAASLRRKGHDVTIVTARPNRSTPLQETLEDGTHIVRIRALNFIEHFFGVTFPIISPLALVSIHRLMRSHTIVHIHDTFYMTSHFAGFLCVLSGRRFYVTQHVGFVDFPNALVMLIQRVVYRLFGDMLFKHASHIVCYNTNVQRFLRSRNVPDDNITLTYNGIDTHIFTPISQKHKKTLRKKYNLPTDKKIALFVGRFVPKKGYDLFAKAYSTAYHTLLVGGTRPEPLPEHPSVTFYGQATGDTLREIYQLSDVFVFPAIGEMITLVQQEAMACGLAQITTENPGYADYNLNPKKFFIIPRTVGSIRRQLEHLVTSPAQLTTMSSYSRKLALERFDWDKNYEREYAIYKKEAA